MPIEVSNCNTSTKTRSMRRVALCSNGKKRWPIFATNKDEQSSKATHLRQGP